MTEIERQIKYNRRVRMHPGSRLSTLYKNKAIPKSMYSRMAKMMESADLETRVLAAEILYQLEEEAIEKSNLNLSQT